MTVAATIVASVSCSAPANAALSNADVEGLWICNMEHVARDGTRLIVTEHDYYSTSGSYESIGTAVVVFDDIGDQIRWMFIATGTFAVVEGEILHTIKSAKMSALPVVGFTHMVNEDVAEMVETIVGPLGGTDFDYSVQVLQHDQHQMTTEAEEGHIQNCHKSIEGAQ
ncbi:MAG: hypothetical protein IPK75_16875 [Acidobacteria bacterium]|nr:hypothetical protein [Acidobacteriota bacterium]